MKRIIFALIVIVSLASCSKKDQVESLTQSVVTNAEFKVSFTVAESQSVAEYRIVYSDKANGEYKVAGLAWPDKRSPEATFEIPVKYTGNASVLFFKVIAVNIDNTTHETTIQSVKL